MCALREPSAGSVSPPVENDRDRALVHQLDLHPRAEGAGLDVYPERAQRLAEALVERLGSLGRSRVGEARPVPLRRVREQRELTDDEGRAAGVEKRAVELSLLVLEDPQARHAPGEPLGRRRVVAARNPDEDAEAGADLGAHPAADEHAGAGDPLDDGSHRTDLTTCGATLPRCAGSATPRWSRASTRRRSGSPRGGSTGPHGCAGRTSRGGPPPSPSPRARPGAAPARGGGTPASR